MITRKNSEINHAVSLSFKFCKIPNPFKPEFTIVIFNHYKPRIVLAILDLDEDDLMWFKNLKKNQVLVHQFHGNFRSKTLSFRKIIKYVFRDVK